MMNNSITVKHTPYYLLLAILCGAIVAFKWEALHLPFFWDESWVYMPAIRTMAEKGPSIMPGSIDADLYTGHPLLFYCMASAWIKFWGYSLPIAHSLPLIISLLLVISVFYITKQFTQNAALGFAASLLLSVQPIFLTQSTFLLIEVWLGLLFVWAFYFHIKQQWFAMTIVAVLALLSKESAFTLIPALGLLTLYSLFKKELTLKQFTGVASLLIVAFVAGFSFFVIQKFKLGWYFFPRHANWINFDEAWFKFKGTLYSIFISQGRVIYFSLVLVTLIWALVKTKNRWNHTQQKFIIASLIFTFGFITFASINFISARYLFGALPLLLISSIFCFGLIPQPKVPLLATLTIAILGCFQLKSSIETTNWSDIELSYTRMLKAQVAFTDYLHTNTPEGKVYAPFLMLTNYNNPYAGMVDKPFLHLTANCNDSLGEFFIRIPNEPEMCLEDKIKNKELTLIKRVECNQAWVELYRKIPNK